MERFKRFPLHFFYGCYCLYRYKQFLFDKCEGQHLKACSKSNSSRHTVWEGMENMSCDFWRFNFLSLFSLFSKFLIYFVAARCPSYNYYSLCLQKRLPLGQFVLMLSTLGVVPDANKTTNHEEDDRRQCRLSTRQKRKQIYAVKFRK